MVKILITFPHITKISIKECLIDSNGAKKRITKVKKQSKDWLHFHKLQKFSSKNVLLMVMEPKSIKQKALNPPKRNALKNTQVVLNILVYVHLLQIKRGALYGICICKIMTGGCCKQIAAVLYLWV